jgi:hypothetical protein
MPNSFRPSRAHAPAVFEHVGAEEHREHTREILPVELLEAMLDRLAMLRALVRKMAENRGKYPACRFRDRF